MTESDHGEAIDGPETPSEDEIPSIPTPSFDQHGNQTGPREARSSEVIEPSANERRPGGQTNGRKEKTDVRGDEDQQQSIISKLSPIKISISPPTTPYMKVVRSMVRDSRWAKEVTLGKRIGLYRFKGELGSGNFSQVKMAIHQLTKDKVAIKTLDGTKMDAKAQRMLRREIDIMGQLCHPNLIQLFEVVETRNSVNLVMEMADEGELFAKITNDGKMSENKSRILFRQIISGVDYMHSRNVIHRDLKAENIYFRGPDTIKVGDFGFSTQVNYMDEALRTFCGSPPYAAPELFQEESYVGAPVDIWALGILLYFMVCGYMPFRASTVIALKNSILEDDFEIPSQISLECSELIRGVLIKAPRKRHTMAHVVESTWLRQASLSGAGSSRPPVARRPSGQRPISGKGVPSRWMYHPWPVLEEDQREPLEKECRLRMARYGLLDEHIETALAHGCRDPVMGIYRITAHTVHREMRLKRLFTPSQIDEDGDSNQQASDGHLQNEIQQHKLRKATQIVSVKRKSRTCNIV